MKKITAIFILLVCSCDYIFSQEEEKINDRYLNISSGVSYGMILDKGYSPNIYKFLTVPIDLGFKLKKKSYAFNSYLNFGYRFLDKTYIPEYLETRFGDYYYAELNISTLFYIGTFFSEKNRIYLGAKSQINASYIEIFSYSNNSQNYALFSDFGPKVEGDYSFKILNKNFVLNYDLSTPLLAYYIRPGYSTPFTTTNGFDFIGNYIRITNSAFLETRIKEINKFSIGYRWQYLSHKGLNKTQHMTNYIMFKLSVAI